MRVMPLPVLIAAGLAASLFCAFQYSAAAPRQRVDPAMSRAMTALTAGEYARAIEIYDQILSQYPSRTEAHFQRAFAQDRLGKFRAAIEGYETTLRLNPQEVRALNNLGFLLVDRSLDVPRGEKLLTRAITLAPDFGAAHDSLGWAEYRKKNYGRAEQLFRLAIKKDPDNRSAYYHAGVLTLKRGDYARAAMYLRKLTERDPTHARGLMGLGMAYKHLGQVQRAQATLASALEIVGRDSAPGREILRMLNELGPYYPGASLDRFLASNRDQKPKLATGLPRNPTRAARPINPALGSPAVTTPSTASRGGSRGASRLDDPSRKAATSADMTRAGEIRGPVVSFRMREGERPSVSDDLPGESIRRLSLLDGDLVQRHLQLANLYEKNDLWLDAASQLRTVINLSPASPEARQARDRLDGMGVHPPLNREARLGGYLRMGEALVERRADEEAKLQYQKVLLEEPTSPVANKALAYLYLRSGDLARALSHIDKAIAREPHYLEALLIRGYIEARRRQFDRSSQTFQRVARLAEPESEIHVYASDMASKMQRFSTLE